MIIRNTTALGLAAGALALLTLAAPARAQDADVRWLPFVGCWEAIGAETEIGLLCFRPADRGVQLTNYVGGEAVSTEMFVADGARRDVSADGCNGWETVEFSEDGRRAFTTTEFVCATGESRTGTGVMTFISPVRWADVRALDVAGEKVAWVQEYQLASLDRLADEGVDAPAEAASVPARAARLAAAAPITLEDVREGTTRMDDKAVETWIVVQRDRLDPTGAELVELADAGVSETVIDAVVAVSFPERFLVEADAGVQARELEGPRKVLTYRGYMAFDPFWGPGYGYSGSLRYGYYGYSPYGYDPFYGRYSGYGYGYGYYGARPGYVIIDRRPSGGRVYNGRGYRRNPGSTDTGRSAQPRNGSQPDFSRGGSSGGSSAGSAPPARTEAPPRRAVRRRGGGEG